MGPSRTCRVIKKVTLALDCLCSNPSSSSCVILRRYLPFYKMKLLMILNLIDWCEDEIHQYSCLPSVFIPANLWTYLKDLIRNNVMNNEPDDLWGKSLKGN